MRDFKQSMGLALAAVTVVVGGLAWWILSAGKAPSLPADSARESVSSEPPTPATAAPPERAQEQEMRRHLVTRLAERSVVEITGRVVDPEGAAVAGATVALRTRRVEGPFEPVRWQTLASVRSDPDGRFELGIDGLVATEGWLTLHAAPYTDLNILELRLPARGAKDLGILRLAPGLRVSGKVVRKVDGSPVPGAQVGISWFTGRGAAGDEVMGVRVETDAEGRFLHASLPSDPVSIEVHAPGLARSLQGMISLPAEVTLELPEAAGLSGSVRDPAGRPLPHATVRVERLGPVATCRAQVDCDGRGSFAFEDLQEGYYFLTATDPEHAPSELPRVHTGVQALEVTLEPLATLVLPLLGVPHDRKVPARVRVWRRAGDVEQLELPVRDLDVERGRVRLRGIRSGSCRLEVCVAGAAPASSDWIEAYAGTEIELAPLLLEIGHPLRGRVTDPQGNGLRARLAIPAAYLAPLAASTPLFELCDRIEAWSDPEGHFCFENLALGSYLVGAAAEGFAEAQRTLEVRPGPRDLEILVLEPEARLRIQVVTLGGQPASEVVVDLRDLSGRGRSMSGTSDSAGCLEFGELPAGRYAVHYSSRAPDHDSNALGYNLLRPGPPTQLDLESGTIRELILKVTPYED